MIRLFVVVICFLVIAICMFVIYLDYKQSRIEESAAKEASKHDTFTVWSTDVFGGVIYALTIYSEEHAVDWAEQWPNDIVMLGDRVDVSGVLSEDQ